jgi:hypothetical protein
VQTLKPPVRHDGRVRLCGCRLTTNDNDDLVVGNIKGFYEGKRPHTCLECTFYQPINQGWFEQRAKDNGAKPRTRLVTKG